MRQDPNFILDTLIYNRHKPQSMKFGRYTWNRKSLLKDYVDDMWNINHKGQQVLNRFYNFKAFLEETGGIHGKTHCGRKFLLYYFEEEKSGMYNRAKYITTNMQVKIYEPDGAAYSPYTQFSDAMNFSILSAVNKYEKKFFYKGKKLKRVESTIIYAKGIYNGKPFDIHLNVGTNGIMMGKFNYCGDVKNLGFSVPIPGHIPPEQHHRFTVRSLCNHDILKGYIFDMIKQNYMGCCGEKVRSGDRFCNKCGKEFEMQGLEITDVKDETKETTLI